MRSSWSDPELEAALVATLRESAVPAGAVDRLLSALPARVPALPVWRRRGIRYGLAIAAAVIVLILGASPQARDAVANTVQQFFYYLPGQGVRRAAPESLVLAERVEVRSAGVTVRVLSVLANGQETTVAFDAEGLPSGKSDGSLVDWPSTVLVDGAGQRYGLRSAASGAGGAPGDTTLSGILVFEPLRPGTRGVTLRMGTWRIALTLVSTSRAMLRPVDLSANVVTLRGVSLRVDQTDHSAGAIVAHVSARGARLSRLRNLELAPPLGPDAILPGSGLTDEFDLRLPVDSTSLRVARVEVVEAGATTVYLSVPPDGSFSLNLKVHLGEYDLILERGRWVEDRNGHTLYLDFRPADVVDGGHIEGFDLDRPGSWGIEWLYATQRGTVMIPNAPTGHVRLQLKNPRAVIDGPWVLPLTTS